jgi:hypothetical protein
MSLPTEGKVRAVLYNLAGKKLCTVFEGMLPKGKRSIYRPLNTFDTNLFGSGMYLLRVYYNENCMHRSIVKIP